jgi:hypothetical protein
VAPGAYVLAEVDGGMLPNTWNADQLRKYYVYYIYLIDKVQCFLAHIVDIVSSHLPVHRLKGLYSPAAKTISLQREVTPF